MTVEPIETLKLLSDLFIKTADRMGKVQKTPKQSFAKDVLALFQILSTVEEHITAIITGLTTFASEPSIGTRVHYIHATGKNIEKLNNTLLAFIGWLAHKPEWVSTLKTFMPTGNSYLKSHRGMSDFYTARLWDIRCQLQAINSPNPEHFPEQQEVDKTLVALEELLQSAQEAKRRIREFAKDNFSIKDLFE